MNDEDLKLPEEVDLEEALLVTGDDLDGAEEWLAGGDWKVAGGDWKVERRYKGRRSGGEEWMTDPDYARRTLATAMLCESCGQKTRKSPRGICRACSDGAFRSLPAQEWDGEVALVVHGDDRFFYDADEIRDALIDGDVIPEDLELCEPGKPPQVDLEDLIDNWGADVDWPASPPAPTLRMVKLADELNELLAGSEMFRTWWPSGRLADVSDIVAEDDD